jgi:hypothetical protein
MRTSCLFLLPAIASSFVILPQNSASRSFALGAEADENKEEEPKGLVLEGLDNELTKMASELPSYELDYLAAAKKRAQEKRESVNSGARDEDWKTLADEKEESVGKIDDWENAQKEAGNTDSQILMFNDASEAGGEEDGKADDDPKLLLF